MAFSNTSAGVYTEDQDLSQVLSTYVSTVGAFVIESPRGIVGEWMPVTSKTTLQSKYGKKDFTSYGYGMHCVEQFVTQSSALVKRVVDTATARTAGAYYSIDDMDASVPSATLVNFDDGTNQPQDMLGDPADNIPFTIINPGVTNVPFAVYAVSPGSWSDELTIRIRPSNPLGTDPGVYSDAYQFYIEVFVNYKGSQSVPVESYLVSRISELDGMNNQLFLEDVVNAQSDRIRVKNNSFCDPVAVLTTTYVTFAGGADGDRPSVSDISSAWGSLSDIDAYSVGLLVNCGYTDTVIHQNMVSVAASRGDAVAILDIPQNMQEVSRAVSYRQDTLNISSSYGTLYAPWLQVLDDVSSKRFWCPPSGMVAAQYAYTARVKAYYWAPAGVKRGTLSKVLALGQSYDLPSRNAFEQAQINVIRKLPKRGYVIFDCSTLQAYKSGFQSVNVRMLVNGIKQIVRNGFLPSCFNPNDSFERLKLKNLINPQMDLIKAGRGINEYISICDGRNNTSAVIANNDLRFDLVIDPEIPAKRASLGVVINNASSVSFSEE